jgi:hypothetical protein
MISNLNDMLGLPQVGHITMILETDQTDCFDEVGNPIDCCDTLQDAEYTRTKLYFSKRFSVCNDIVEDKLTGLLWQKNASLSEYPQTWMEALDFVKDVNDSKTSNLINWRLPTRSELYSLLSHQNINPCLPERHPFENVFNGYYWTQTECSRLPDQAWYVHLGGGRVQEGMKHGSYMVWPVAGSTMEEKSVNHRFHMNRNVIYDSITKRTWLNEKALTQGAVTWKEAINFIKNINNIKAGFSDWRLPNIRELESLVDTAQHSPAFAMGCSFDKIQEGYWSSTTSLYEPKYAWVLYTRDGAIGVGFKPHADFFILPVRG